MAGLTKGIRGLSLEARQYLNGGGNPILYPMSFPCWDQIEFPDGTLACDIRIKKQENKFDKENKIRKHDLRLMARHIKTIAKRQNHMNGNCSGIKLKSGGPARKYD